MMTNPVGMLVRGEYRKTARVHSVLGQFDPARLLRFGIDGDLHAGHMSAEHPEETLVVDVRASIRPAQAVERKLMRLLDGKAFSMSQIRTASFSSRSRSAFE
jgi:hypothetical protein